LQVSVLFTIILLRACHSDFV